MIMNDENSIAPRTRSQKSFASQGAIDAPIRCFRISLSCHRNVIVGGFRLCFDLLGGRDGADRRPTHRTFPLTSRFVQALPRRSGGPLVP